MRTGFCLDCSVPSVYSINYKRKKQKNLTQHRIERRDQDPHIQGEPPPPRGAEELQCFACSNTHKKGLRDRAQKTRSGERERVACDKACVECANYVLKCFCCTHTQRRIQRPRRGGKSLVRPRVPPPPPLPCVPPPPPLPEPTRLTLLPECCASLAH